MAEIRSTMEMVLERAARLEAEAGDALAQEEKIQDGMRLAARYLADEELDMDQALSNRESGELALILQGAVQSFMRNIVLPREDEPSPLLEKALQGLLLLGQSPETLAGLGEIKTIIEQYLQHKKQLMEQLEMQFAQQMGMMEDNLSQQTGVKMDLKPSQHPKFAEEWQKVMVQLNEQYGQALEQQKTFIQQSLLAG
ncbi:MAG: DUF6657 family protein [Thermodesulfobacteriota bacterium]